MIELPKAEFNLTTLLLLFVAAFPGLVSMQVYRAIVPSRAIEWKNGLLEGFFYTGANYKRWPNGLRQVRRLG